MARMPWEQDDFVETPGAKAAAASAKMPWDDDPVAGDLDTGMNVPEKPETLQAQQKAVQQGLKPAVMYPAGTDAPPIPAGLVRTETPRGIFDHPKSLSRAKVRELSAQGRENEILGLGPIGKPDIEKFVQAGEPPMVITERAPDGTEIKAAVGTPSTISRQLPEFASGKFPDSVIGVERPEDVVAGRQAPAQDKPVPVMPLDDPGRFRDITGGTNPARPGADQRGMLTGAEAYDEWKGKKDAAEAAVTEAQKRFDVAQDAYRRVAPDLPPGETKPRVTAKSFGDAAVIAEYQRAQAELEDARKAYSAAQRSVPPTQTKARAAINSGMNALVTMPADIAAGAMRPFDSIVKDTGTAQALRKWSEKIVQESNPDPARAEEFTTKMGSAIGSAIGFVLTGAAGRAAGLPGWAASGGAGALQEAEQSYRQADQLGKDWKTKAAAYLAGLGIGSTEAIGIGRIFEAAEKATGGGVKRYLGLMLKEAGEEGFQEGLQQILGNLRDKQVLGKPIDDITQGMWENVLIGALVGAGMAGTIGLPGAFARNPQTKAINEAAGVGAPATPMFDQDKTAPAPGAQPQFPEGTASRLQGQNSAPGNNAQQQDSAAPPADVGTIAPQSADIPADVGTTAPQDTPETRILRAGGYTDEEIAAMPEGNRTELVDMLQQEGVTDPGPSLDGTRARPVRVESPEQIEPAAAQVNTEPTPAQAEAGNYKKGHVKFDGLNITIENPKGSTRSGTDSDGETWQTVMPGHYGYIKRTKGADGDKVDVTIGDAGPTGTVFVIDQYNPKTGRFDEHKLFAGYRYQGDAVQAYQDSFSDGSGAQRMGAVSEITVDELKNQLANGNWKRPFAPKPRKPQPPRESTAPRKPQSLTQFVRSMGGVKEWKGEVAAIGANAQPGVINNKTGRDLDYMREAAAEAGYLPMDSTVADFLNLLQKGNDVFLPGDMNEVLDWKEREAAAYGQQSFTEQDEIFAYLTVDEGLSPSEIDSDILDRAAEFVRQGSPIELAYERAVVAWADETPAADDFRSELDAIEWPEFETSAPAQDSGRPAQDVAKPEDVAGPAAESRPAGADNAQNGAQQAEEPGADGKPQLVIPGAEQIGQGQQAQMAADKPLRPTKPQKDAGGLFGDDSKQGDLLDVAAKPAAAPDNQSSLRLTRKGPWDFKETFPSPDPKLKEGLQREGRWPFDAESGSTFEQEIAATFEESLNELESLVATQALGRSILDQVAKGEKLPKGRTPAQQQKIAKEAISRSTQSIRDIAGEYADIFGRQAAASMVREARIRFAAERSPPKSTPEGSKSTPEGSNTPPTDTFDADFEKGFEEGQAAADAAEKPPKEKKKRAPSKRKPKETKAAVAASAVKNTAEAADAAMSAIVKIFNNPGRFGSGLIPEVDEKTWEEIKPMLRTAATKFAAAKDDVVKLVSMMVQDMRKSFGLSREGMARLKPYLRRFVADVREGKISLDEASTPIDEPQAKPGQRTIAGVGFNSSHLPHVVAAHFLDGQGFRSIIEARKFAKDEGQGDLNPKQVEEAIETGLVIAAREIVGQGNSASQTYDALVDLYSRQPRLGTRTGTSVAEQAYSTPVPLAYLAARAAGIDATTKVYEPSAGNGALVMTARESNVVANEINPDRRNALELQGFEPLNIDASSEMAASAAIQQNGDDLFEAVIANPPFGTVKSADGSNKRFDMSRIQPGYVTGEIDHAIALKALETMRPDGSAVLILGGINKLAKSDEARSDGYNGKAKREFYLTLYQRYGVVDHFTVAGELYERQGAGYPVDVIVIRGTQPTGRKLPSVDVPKVYNSWAELKEKLDVDYPAARAGRAETGLVADGTPGGRADVGNAGDRADTVGSGRPDVGEPGSQQPGGVRGQRGGAKSAIPVAPGDVDGSRGDAGRDAQRADPRPDAEPRQPRIKQQDEETEGQVAYAPASRDADGLGTLVPANMQTAVQNALKAVGEKRGGVDSFVAETLEISQSKLADYFAAEQVDALALALDAIEEGDGFIIGDQTGIGKGRVNAAIIRYALVKGLTPIFVTEKPNLYADMYRDLTDIGIQEYLGRDVKPLMTNSGLPVPLDEEGKRSLKTAGTGPHRALLDEITANRDLGAHDVLFTTYAQLQTVKGEATERQRLLEALAGNSILILDESHNAGGTEASDFIKKKPGAALNRAEFIRKLVADAKGVFYSSATFAKRPSVMDLYARTDMRLAVPSLDTLGDTIAKGGVPMQQVVSAMLAEAGQYLRRERSFAGVSYDTVPVDVDVAAYDGFSQSLAAVHKFSALVNKAVKGMDKELKADAKSVSHDGSTGGAGASSTNFTAIMHNLINQMLLAIKVEPAAQRAIAYIEAGEKPVLTLASTMESFLDEYAQENDLAIGSPIDATFKSLLLRYLERTRTITLKKPFSKDKGERKYLSDLELGPAGLKAYEDAKKVIERAAIADLPVSPIDALANRIQRAGYKVGEITGRGLRVDYSKPSPMLDSRSSADKKPAGRLRMISEFNSGKLDAIILNQSGATGLSLHASAKFSDQRKRRMILIQPENNIDTHMQMLGRVHRTGQVITPGYDQLVAMVPAEKRPASVLAKKMASLNASTTASRDSALKAKDVPDFMNEYGDAVAIQVMSDNPDINRMLGEPIDITEKENKDAMRKVTGRIPMLPVRLQEQVYSMLEDAYTTFLEEKEQAGENVLEAKRLDLDARAIEAYEVVPGEGTSPFARPVVAEIMDVKRQKKPLGINDVLKQVAETLKIEGLPENTQIAMQELAKAGTERTAAITQKALADFDGYRKEFVGDLESEGAVQRATDRLNANRNHFERVTAALPIGNIVRLHMDERVMTAIVVKVDKTGNAQNPLAMGSWKVTLAAPGEGLLRMSLLGLDAHVRAFATEQEADAYADLITVEPSKESAGHIADLFDQATMSMREKRIILTGNLLKAYDFSGRRGRILNFTTKSGAVRQGILMPDSVKGVAEIAKSGGVSITSAQGVLDYLKEKREIASDDAVTLRLSNGILEIRTPAAKAKGGRFYLNPAVREIIGNEGADFIKRGPEMVVDLSTEANFFPVIDALMKAGTVFSKPATVKEIEPPQPMAIPRPRTDNESIFTPRALEAGIDKQHVQDVVQEIVDRVTGGRVKAAVVDQLFIPKESAAAAGLASSGRPQEAAGMYFPGERIIAVSYRTTLSPTIGIRNTTHHEAFHALQDLAAMTEQEKALLEREAPRMREMIANTYGAEVYNFPQVEVEAYAYGFYAAARDAGRDTSGLHIGVRRLFERIYQILRRIRNYFEGLGFQTAEDIFEGARTGAMQARLPREALSGATAAPMPMAVPGTRRRRSGLAVDPQSLASKGVQNYMDRFVRVREFEQALRRDGFSAPDASGAIARMYSRLENRADEFDRLRITPLMNKIAAAGFSNSDVQYFLYAAHAQDRNAIIAARNPNRPDLQDGGSGMTNQEAQDLLDAWNGTLSPARLAAADPGWRQFLRDAMANSAKLADMQAIANDVYRIIAEDRRRRVRAGLMTQAQADAWENTFGPNYIPLQGWEGTDGEEDLFPNAGSGVQVRGREAQSAMGRTSLADDILAHVLDNSITGLRRVEKNFAGNKILLLARAMERAWGDRSPMREVMKTPKRRYLDLATNTVIEIPDKSFKNEPNYFTTKVGGQEIAIEIDKGQETALAKELKNLGISTEDDLVRGLGAVTRVYSKMRTVWNPFFAPVNFTRDVQDALIAVSADEQATKRQFVKQLPGAMKEVVGWILAGQETADHQNFRLDGGKISFSKLQSLEKLRARVKHDIDGVGVKGLPAKGAHQIAHILENWSDIFELSVRYALYRTKLAAGGTRAQAASLALEGTMNFYRAGSAESLRWFRSMFPFFNPAVQGNLRAARLIKQAGGFNTSTGRTAVTLALLRGGAKTYGAYLAIGFIAEAINYILGGSDDDKTPWIEKLDHWRREAGIVIYTGGKDKFGRPEAVNIPAFPEIMLPVRLGQGLARMIWGKDKSLKWQWQNVAGALWKMTPLEGRQMGPAVGSWAFQLAMNKNFFGGPIHPDQNSRQRGTPDAYTSFASTPDAWKNLAAAVNKATGGGEKSSGLIDWHPETFRLFAREALGAWYGNADYAASMFGLTEPPSGGNPLIRRFTVPGSAHAQYEREQVQKQTDEINANVAYGKRKYESQDTPQRQRLQGNLRQRRQIEAEGLVVGSRGGISDKRQPTVKAMQSELGYLRRQMNAVRKSGGSPAEQKEKMDDLRFQYSQVQKKYRLQLEEQKKSDFNWRANAGRMRVIERQNQRRTAN